MRTDQQNLIRLPPSDAGDFEVGAGEFRDLVQLPTNLVALLLPRSLNVIGRRGQGFRAKDIALTDVTGELGDVLFQAYRIDRKARLRLGKGTLDHDLPGVGKLSQRLCHVNFPAETLGGEEL
jgi:hypothetical protein